MRPSLVAAAIRILPLCSKTTGDEVKSPPAEYQSFCFSVFGSSAASTASPPDVATYNVPSGLKAAPADPTGELAPDFHTVTSCDARSRAHTPLAAPPQPFETAA